MTLPYQGSINVDPRLNNAEPTLLPNFFPNLVGATGFLDAKSPSQYLNDNSRADATATVTIGGSITAGDTVTMKVTQAQLPSGSISVTHTVLTSETIQEIAESLASQFNAAVEAQLGNALSSMIYATTGFDTIAHEAVLTMHWNGPLGNSAVLSTTLSGGATETAVVAPGGGAMAGGTGPVFAANNFKFSYGNSVMAFMYGKPYLLDSVFIAALASQDMPVV